MTQQLTGAEDNQTKKFREYIEKESLMTITNLIETGAIDDDRAADMSQYVLDLIKPEMTIGEIYQNVVKLDDKYSEFAPLVYKIMNTYEKVFNQKTIDHASGLIKKGNYDEAQHAVKKVLSFKIK